MKTLFTDNFSDVTAANWWLIVVTGILLLIMGIWIVLTRAILLLVNAGSKRSLKF